MPSGRVLALAYISTIAAGYAFVFIVPWHSPANAVPTISDSYMLGFDNRLAMAGVFASLGALLALGWRRRGADGPLVLDAAPPRDERVSLWLVTLLLVISVVSAMFFAWLAVNAYGYGEKNYFLDRLAYVLAGLMPYRDVEFAYGPLLIYLPAWVSQALHPLGIGAAGAYSLTWIVTYVSGVPLLAWCVNRLALTRPQRNVTFMAIGIPACFNESLGMNGLLLRFLMPAVALLALHTATSQASGRRPITITAAAAACGLAGWAVSPEVGIAVLAGSIVYLTAMKQPARLPAMLGLAVAPLAGWALFGAASLHHLLGMAGGVLNFPVVPGAPMLVLLAAALAAASLLPRHLGGRNLATAAALGLATSSATMLIGALGRADSSHAYFYGIPVALLACGTLARRSRRVFAAFALMYALVFLSAHIIIMGEDYRTAVVEAALSRPEIPERQVQAIADFFDLEPEIFEELTARATRLSKPDVALFEPYAPLAAPVGFRDDLGLALAERRWLSPTYFRGTPFTSMQLDAQIASLELARYLIVPDSYAKTLQIPPPAWVPPKVLGGFRYWTLFMWLDWYPVRHVPPDLSSAMLTWVREHYGAVAAIGGYTVLERKQ